ncbi:MAG: EAL domain-containing protein [Lachnospiraceae bacterium]|nr:EAL domain-containing protein [Lachnospiraceae bacterium]
MEAKISEGMLSGVRTDLPDYYRFRDLVKAGISENAGCLYALAAIDIDHFKLFNEMYGRSAGDNIITETARHLKHYALETGGIAGYFGNDDFALFLPWEKTNAGQLYRNISSFSSDIYRKGFFPSIGLHIFRDTSAGVDDLYDRAVIALNSIRDSFTEHLSVYDDAHHGLIREKHKLLIDAHRGLAEEEFTFFLQPKCAMDTGKIIGAEALVRWNHSERGMVSPGEFISILEDHNCITAFDMYIWEEVCKWQRSLIDEGIEPLPCSVNVSRVDFSSLDVAGHFKNLTKRYDLEPSLIELEVTESAFVDTGIRIDEAVERLRADGFRILMDDFGTGSSSLRSLRDLKFDVLKTDIRFLDKIGHSRTGMDIMESVLNIATLIGVPMIVEGAETREQIEDLLSIGCSYAQGFYFHQPMHRDQYKQLITRQNHVDRREMVPESRTDLDISDVLYSNIYSKETLNSIFGAVMFIETDGNVFHVLKVNKKMRKLLDDVITDKSSSLNRVEAFLDRHRDLAEQVFTIAEMNLVDGYNDVLSARRSNGMKIRIPLRAFLLNERAGKKVFYINVIGVEQELNYEELRQELRSTKEQLSFLKSAMNRLPNPVFMKDDSARFLFFNEQYAKAFGMRQEDYIGKTVLDLDYLPEKDRERFQQEDEELIRTESEVSYESDFLFSDEQMHFSLYWSTGVHDKRTGKRGLVGEIVDITRERLMQQKLDAVIGELRETNIKLEETASYDSGTGVFNRTVLNRKEAEYQTDGAGMKACMLMCDLDHFKRVNDAFGHTEGDAVLAKFGKILLQECRYDDLPVRYGGEEFLLFLNNESLEDGEAVAECIRKRCENEILLPDGEPITVSIGVSMLDTSLSLVENIAQVDRYLYLAKKRGRNCVISGRIKRGQKVYKA